jgi:hypothetical protein
VGKNTNRIHAKIRELIDMPRFPTPILGYASKFQYKILSKFSISKALNTDSFDDINDTKSNERFFLKKILCWKTKNSFPKVKENEQNLIIVDNN